MKKLTLISLLILALFPGMAYNQIAQNFLLGVEKKIKNAQKESFKQDTVAPLQLVLDALKLIQPKPNNHWKEYWNSYALYQTSIFYAYGKKPDVEKGKAYVEEAINTLKKVENKNSEDYALLGFMKGYSLQWKSMLAMAKQSGVASKWVQKAVDIDDQNPRANYAFGNNDYFKPKFFGGGKKADMYLTNAIALYKESIPNPLLPSWGMEDAYNKLIKTKMKADASDDAQKLLSEALDKFSNSKQLLQLAKELNQ